VPACSLTIIIRAHLRTVKVYADTELNSFWSGIRAPTCIEIYESWDDRNWDWR